MQAERRLNKRKILDNRQQPNLIGTHDHACLFFMFLYFLSNLYWGGTKPHAVLFIFSVFISVVRITGCSVIPFMLQYIALHPMINVYAIL